MLSTQMEVKENRTPDKMKQVEKKVSRLPELFVFVCIAFQATRFLKKLDPQSPKTDGKIRLNVDKFLLQKLPFFDRNIPYR